MRSNIITKDCISCGWTSKMILGKPFKTYCTGCGEPIQWFKVNHDKEMPVDEVSKRTYLGSGQHVTEGKCPTCRQEVYTHSFKFPLKFCGYCGTKLAWNKHKKEV